MSTSAIHHMLDVIPLRELIYLCKASYKPFNAAKKCLENHNVSWEALFQTDLSYNFYGSWKVTIFKHKTLNEYAFTVEGTSSVRNWVAGIVNQLTKKTCIIKDVQHVIEYAQEIFHMQINYGMGHSAGGFIAEQAVKNHRLSQICVMTLNSQRPQVDGNFINIRSMDDTVSKYPLAACDRTYTVPGASGHKINGFKEVKNTPWENIVPGYRKAPGQEVAPSSPILESASSPVKEAAPKLPEFSLKSDESNLLPLQQVQSPSFSERLPTIIGSVTGLSTGAAIVEGALRWYNGYREDKSDKWVRTAYIAGGCAATAFNIYHNKSSRFSLISTMATTILAGTVGKSAIELHRSFITK